MAQEDSKESVDARHGIFTQLNKNEAFTCGTSYANALVFSAKFIRESVFVIKNDDATIGMDYKIYGSLKNDADATTLTDDDWVNLLSIKAGHDGTTYDHDQASALDATKKVVETLDNPYSKIVVQIKSDSGTPTAKVWHRGEN